MIKSSNVKISAELKNEINSLKKKIKLRIGVELTGVEITKLIARKIKKTPIRIKKIGRGYKVT